MHSSTNSDPSGASLSSQPKAVGFFKALMIPVSERFPTSIVHSGHLSLKWAWSGVCVIHYLLTLLGSIAR